MRASVIIPHHNRQDHLSIVLEAILRQTACDYEVIVVDDGSACSVSVPEGVRLIQTPHRGAASARNRGIKEAQGELLIFIDCDIVVEPDFIENHCRFHEGKENAVAIGTRSNDTRLKLLARYGKKVEGLNHPWFMTYTCNVSVRQKVLFDERYMRWGLEDSEWAYRLYLGGAKFLFLETVNTTHLYHDRTMTEEKFLGWKTNLDYTIAKHPELAVLRCFEGVFNPEIKSDYFTAYDKFEGVLCVI